MIARRDHKTVFFTFSTLECKVLERVLGEIIGNYKLPPQEFDQKSAAVWYSTRGCQTARMSAEETAEWIKQLHSVRSARTELLQKWLQEVRSRSAGAFTLAVPIEQTDTLITALNDHRLLVAARHDIGEREMDTRTFSALTKLPAPQQMALYDIHFLAYMIEELLHLLLES